MAITIDQLEIDIDGNASRAASGLDQLIASLRRVEGTVGGATNALHNGAGAMRSFASPLANVKDSADKASGKLSVFFQSLVRIAKYRLIRSALKSITQGLKEGVQNLARYSAAINSADAAAANSTMSAYATTLLELKNAAGAAAMPLLQALLPVINTIASAAITAANAVNQLISVLQGKATFTRAKSYAVDYADSLKKVGGAAKEAKNTLLSFDELNVLNDPDSGRGGGAAAQDYSKMFEESDIGAGFKKIGNMVNKVKEFIKENLEDIEKVAAGFALGIGLALLLTGANIPLGLGLVAAGAYTLGTDYFGDEFSLSKMVDTILKNIELVASGLLLGLGLILALTGANLPLGLGLMAAGAIGLGAELMPKWRDLPDGVYETFMEIASIVSLGMFTVGAVLAFSGANIGLGLGLMVAGAAAGASVGLNWDQIPKETQDTILKITRIVSGALIAVGAVIAFATPAKAGLGVGLMVAGAVGLAASVAVNWKTMPDEVKETVVEIATMLAASLLAIGGVIAFSGANIPLGIGLMVAGAAGLAAIARIGYDVLPREIRSSVGKLAAILGGSLLVVGAVLAFSGANLPLGIGLMIAGGASLATAAALNWDSILENLKGTWDGIKSWWSNNVASLVSKDHWSNIGNNIITGLREGLQNAWTKVSTWFAEKFAWVSNTANNIKNTIAGISDDSAGTTQSFVSERASGGTVDNGQLFIAREAGPELVGTMGRRTAVANNDQITTGIARAVSAANEELINAVYAVGNKIVQASESRSTDVYIDSRKITQAQARLARAL